MTLFPTESITAPAMSIAGKPNRGPSTAIPMPKTNIPVAAPPNRILRRLVFKTLHLFNRRSLVGNWSQETFGDYVVCRNESSQRDPTTKQHCRMLECCISRTQVALSAEYQERVSPGRYGVRICWTRCSAGDIKATASLKLLKQPRVIARLP